MADQKHDLEKVKVMTRVKIDGYIWGLMLTPLVRFSFRADHLSWANQTIDFEHMIAPSATSSNRSNI